MDLQSFLSLWDQRYSEQHHMIGSRVPTGHYHCGLEPGTVAHHTRESLIYAIALLQSGEAQRVRRAADVVSVVLSLQDTDPANRTCGIWPMYLEEPLGVLRVPDFNYADFIGSQLLHVLIAHSDDLPADLVQALLRAIRLAADAIVRRDVGPGYTNIAFSGAAVTAAAAEQLGDPGLIEYARERLLRIERYTEDQGGFNEYNSPGYAIASMRWCEWIDQFVRDEPVREAAGRLLRTLWAAYADHFHPATGQLVGPQSRAYQDWLTGPVVSYLRERTGVRIVCRGAEPVEGEGPESFFGYIKAAPCPEDLTSRFGQLPRPEFEQRRRYIRRETDEASVWGTSWFSREACLGSANHDNLWTQRRPVLGYWRTDEDRAVVLRVRFLRNGVDFASAYIRNAQKGSRVLSLFSLLTNKGDWHDHIDRPGVPGRFPAEDFRVRYELIGRGVTGKDLGDGRYELSAGEHKAIVHTAPGRFGPHQVTWELGRAEHESDSGVTVDGVCYAGPEREFTFGELGDVLLAAAVEVLPEAADPTEAPVTIRKTDDEKVEATWLTRPPLRVTGHARAHPYE